MKRIIFIISILLLSMSCSSPNKIANDDNKVTMKPEKNDDGEWDLEVLDSQWSYFLNAVAKPISMYSENQLKSRNAMLVSEWNSYYFSGRYRNIIESSIEYNPQENYGLNFEYKLYQVFAYVQWKYGLKLNGLSMTEVR